MIIIGLILLVLLLLALIAVLVLVAIDFNRDNTHAPSPRVVDIIWVGTGSAASMAMRRVSDAHPEVSIYALEWGLYHNLDPEVNTLADLFVPWQNPIWSRSIVDIPDPGRLFQTTVCQHGNMLGGTGNHDFTQTYYPSDYLLNAKWAAAGGSEWNAANARVRFKRSETFFGTPNPSRGTTGCLAVLNSSFEVGGSTADQIMRRIPTWFTADASVPFVDDYNLGQSTSATLNQQNWLRPVMGPPVRSAPGLDCLGPLVDTTGAGIGAHANLTVELGAFATKLLINADRHAYGVQYIDKHGQEQTILANKEIVVSMGAFNTPPFLERSGYGNATKLSALGITTIYDNPLVGEGLMNHIGVPFIVNTNATFSPIALESFQALLSVLPEMNGTRLIQMFGATVLSAFLQQTTQRLLNIPTPGLSAFTVFAFLMQPLSVGSVHIVSSQPSKEPLLQHNTFTDPTNRDMRAMLETMRSLKHLFDAQAAADVSHSYDIIYPTAAAWADSTNATLTAQIQSISFYASHWAATCRMGPLGAGVVDGSLKLQGITGVRIVDNSVSPDVNDGNTRATAVLIGEAAGDFINAEL